MTVDEVIKFLKSEGWRQTKDDESCRQLKHDAQTKTVTISGQLELVVPRGVLRTLRRHAQLDEGT